MTRWRKRRGRAEGSIFQRADGTWTASVSSGYDGAGKRRRRTVYGKTKGEVQEKLRALQNDASVGIVESGKLTVGEYLTRWLAVIKPTVEPNTYALREQHVRLHIAPHLGSIRLAKLDAFAVEQMYAALEKGKVSAAMRRRVGTTLGTALRAAVASKILPYDPSAGVAKPRTARHEIRVLDPDQVPAFLAAARTDRLFPLYALALDSGMRQGELFGLAWGDVDFEAGTVQVRRSLEEIKGTHRLKDVKTARARRRIDLSSWTMALLHDHRKAMLAEGRDVREGPVFVDSDGGWLRKPNVGRRSFKPILKRAGVPEIRFHDLRHTCATLLLLAEVNVKVVSERLGHASVTITLDTYSHVLPTMQKGAAEKMGLILGRLVATPKANGGPA